MKEMKQNQQSMHNQNQSLTNIIAAFKEEKTISTTSKNSKPNVCKSFNKETHIIKKKVRQHLTRILLPRLSNLILIIFNMPIVLQKPNPPTQTPVIAKSLSGSTRRLRKSTIKSNSDFVYNLGATKKKPKNAQAHNLISHGKSPLIIITSYSA